MGHGAPRCHPRVPGLITDKIPISHDSQSLKELRQWTKKAEYMAGEVLEGDLFFVKFEDGLPYN